jgi:putative heme-binding domain-containing protein
VNFLRFHRDPTTAARARRVFGPLPRSTGTPDFSPVLKLKGSEAVGRRAYLQLCSGCHEFGSLGREVGPRLDAEGLRSETELLRDILEPSRSIAPGYETQVVRCTNNQLLYGMVRQLGGGYIGILQPDGKHVTLPGLAVEEITPQEWSFMPANTAVGLSFSDLASLVAFLRSGSEPP